MANTQAPRRSRFTGPCTTPPHPYTLTSDPQVDCGGVEQIMNRKVRRICQWTLVVTLTSLLGISPASAGWWAHRTQHQSGCWTPAPVCAPQCVPVCPPRCVPVCPPVCCPAPVVTCCPCGCGMMVEHSMPVEMAIEGAVVEEQAHSEPEPPAPSIVEQPFDSQTLGT
jgi:hypothetical protein